RAKAINFGIIYGISAFGLANQLGIDRGEASDYIKAYFQKFPGIRKYMDETKQFAKDNLYVETAFGRKLHLKEMNSKNGAMRAFAERQAINAPIQGSAADIIKRAMIAVAGYLQQQSEDDIKLLMQVHDELVFEVKADSAEMHQQKLCALMEGAADLDVALIADWGLGDNWDEAH
ncbi:MAG: DNA polymerase I, partial [Methylococcales bacterium]|nr:DNA polymerase I [Methylococcales bacterium]